MRQTTGRLLQLGVLRKDRRGNFNPQLPMQTAEFAAALGQLLQLPSGALAGYPKGELTREVMGAIVDQAYH